MIIRYRNFLLGFIFVSIPMLFTMKASTAETLIRLTPSTPKELLIEIYNNALIGHDRLSDIENYMSAGLQSDYKKALKSVKRGKNCGIPRILTNGIFSAKLKGFNVDQIQQKGWSADAKVILDTGSNNLPSDSQLRKFDPKIYETINFKFVKRFINWKIDDIKSSEPDLEQATTGVNYKSFELRKLLKACK